MPVMFKTQQGRVLYNRDLSAADVTRTVGVVGVFPEIVGEELVGQYNDGRPILRDGTTFHVNPWHIVEWWDTKVGT